MITLAKDCLLFQLSDGEKVPFSAEMISVELTGETGRWFEPEVASHAAKAVFHYFKWELGRQSVTAEEFAAAMEKVLKGLELGRAAAHKMSTLVVESDLRELARDAGNGCELLFFPKLREELRHHLRQAPRVMRFHGLRACVKHITGARRWTSRCQLMEDQIVGFLRECAGAEAGKPQFALLVE
ncbi:MAG TPA: hypothetical protein VKY92_09395 [Verrucomicrobiae bacterium]|jgi:hypothetical protein|nr:hypothetical protein [Verrucomicrobiae bacterium]